MEETTYPAGSKVRACGGVVDWGKIPLNYSAEFVDDISVPGMIYAKIIRSPVARGVLREIACPRFPNSYHLIRAEHIPGENTLAGFPVPVLADKTLSYAGEPVAILAGPEIPVLENLAAQIKVTAAEETPEFSCVNYFPENVITKREISSGDPGKAFGGNGVIFSDIFETGIQEHWYPEPHGVIAVPGFSPAPEKTEKVPEKTRTKKDREAEAEENTGTAVISGKAGKEKKESNGLVIYTATQWPYHVKSSVAGVMGWKRETVNVYPTRMAESLDGKIWYPSLMACHAALAAKITGKPVKLVLTKEEDFLYSSKRNGAGFEIRSAVGENGELLGTSIQARLNLGASGIFADEITDQSCLGALGVYDHKTFHISGAGIRTNLPPQGPMAGFGLSQGFFAAERHISIIADSLGQDPAEYRKKIFIRKNQHLAIGTPLKNPAPLAELVDAALVMSDYRRKWASYELLRNYRKTENKNSFGESVRGIGISVAFQGNGFLNNDESGNGNCALEMTLGKDGSLEIKSSILPAGGETLFDTARNSGLYSGSRYPDTWRNLARDILGVEPSMVKLVNNTGDAPDSGPATLSRNTGFLTRLVERCCTAIRKQRFRDPLPITVRRSFKPEKAGSWIPERKIDPEAFSRPSWGAAVVEIEFEPVCLEPLIRGVWLAVDGGKILSQRQARRTLRMGIIQALGWAYREQVHYESGKIPDGLYRSFSIPDPPEVPPIHVDFIRNDSAGPRGIGDLPFGCVPAAYVQAVSQAMDYPFRKIPLRARDIRNAGFRNETEDKK